MTINLKCQICGNDNDNKQLIANEMMFGTRDEFQYLECGQCGCLQLIDVPENLSTYYPPDYYSFQEEPGDIRSKVDSWIKKKVAIHRWKGSFIGKLLLPLHKRHLRWLGPDCGINKNSRILDVGCGGGKLLKEMKHIGFRNLTGIDPYIESDIDLGDLPILKRELHELDGEYDFIMFHHSFEHMIDPKVALNNAVKLLAKDGSILIRVPVADSYAYKTYGVNWVELDAPRHIFLHTVKSMESLVSACDMEIHAIRYDSSRFEIVGSEKHKRGIPSSDDTKIFSKEELTEIDEQVDKLNENGEGGRACFYIKPVGQLPA
ncbi:class I SAM-dependent methyltransferase [Marinoscillum sp. MHG1-6]|uniref:class I SAM-dependent methyltransferase n=1 Tax=Marinoscillum sp. MHG1-6 TaxID=2959627 RepID=UPI00215811FB|nr:class I SAM-dependent methyltransferase [Marinoscillum sp. MHG1-6]